MFFPRRCPVCGRVDRAVCPTCAAELVAKRPAPARLRGLRVDCGVDRLRALWAYGPEARSVILALKNGARGDLAPDLAHQLTAQFVPGGRSRPPLASGDGLSRPEMVIWVPASGRGRRRRGYDQGRLLARAVAARLGVPARPLLVRADGGGGADRGRAARLAGPRLRARSRPPSHCLLVDDVVTTGASMAAASVALRRAGAVRVDAAALAVVDAGVRAGGACTPGRSRRLEVP